MGCACFLRTDHEHHALALFGSAETRLDHISCETRDIGSLAAWADRVAGRRVPLHWGVGRHGPGNDVFFMVKDPDDNLIELWDVVGGKNFATLKGRTYALNAVTGPRADAGSLVYATLADWMTTPGPVSQVFEGSITLSELRLRWQWDPLRTDSRFQKILAGPEPKTVYH